MKFKPAGTAFLLSFSLIAAGCNSEGNQNDDSESVQETTRSEDSNDNTSASEEVTESPDNSQESTNDQSAGDENETGSEDNSNEPSSQSDEPSAGLPEGIEQTDYESEDRAAQAIENYREVEQTNTDLGHSIQALVEGATGHQYISWNEGRWLIQMDFPTDSQYAYEPYPEGVELAKEVVEYLESHYLPAPEDRGMISINGFSDSPETVIQWQKGKSVYEITNNNGKPFKAIDKAVEFGETERSSG
ncbi:hypothetical protein D3H55_11300 [Bacillus salacetis]|uniref:Lipoprotein n=1 Tax=Bacillus salacetis TaxID=2315464 RepID=A0A3A1QX94_9BACI|nr:hypothetical protein [Bacillus salacetis]RIW33238.1 hypothetical protein D3H55_11300 [Bacillus salacetis]